jgi:hypothetical protein
VRCGDGDQRKITRSRKSTFKEEESKEQNSAMRSALSFSNKHERMVTGD